MRISRSFTGYAGLAVVAALAAGLFACNEAPTKPATESASVMLDHKSGHAPKGPPSSGLEAVGLELEVVEQLGGTSDEAFKSQNVFCPAGKLAVGGGGSVGGISGGSNELRYLVSSFPIVQGGVPTGWTAQARKAEEAPTGAWRVTAYAVCAALEVE